MRSALICVFFALVVHKDSSCAENEEDFKPTPIPLNEWPRQKHDAAGTLQEIIKTELPPTVAVVPAHYWEDALRHSVYLTLVRDKIDQLIAKGTVISPDSKPESHLSKEVDDHDLWEKIKTARFDRVKEEPIPPSDVTILAKGRLFEDEEGFRFAEDDASRSNCSETNCTQDVKAYWSVKRIRQGETPAKYHYELTFSVTSQTNRKLKKPYENPVRTFTIKENSPTERPQARNYEHVRNHGERPQRAVWVHKNIGHTQSTQRRPSYNRGLDRIFSSLFSDEDSYEEPPYRHKQKTYISQIYPQHAKAGYADDIEQYNQKKIISYPVPKPQAIRYTHPPIPPPPPPYVQHPYLNVDSMVNSPYVLPYSDNRFVPSNVVKTTRPAFLPTPVPNYPLQKESSIDVPVKTKLNGTENTSRAPDVQTTYRIYTPKQPMKINYFPDHIRPPVYNAPPGVFVTMDKKPFKPMPPLKYGHSTKPQKTLPPDFRPSPQVHDTQYTDPDAIGDTAFRPISMDYSEMLNVKESNDTNKKGNKNIRKPSAAKKHEVIKPHRLTTVKPEIITAQSFSLPAEEDNSMEWANLLGAFTKTTPMASHRERGSTEITDPITSTTPLSTTPTENSAEDIEDIDAAYEAEIISTSSSTTTSTTTTPKPKKRTRPPPKFNKQEKIKYHKRVTSTTTTTAQPTPKNSTKKPSDDLTPQASSAATSGTNSVWETKTHKAPITTTSSTTTSPSTPTKMTTTTLSSTTSTPSTQVDTEQPVVTTQPKSKNRFRQSTLRQKGTSVNHGKWSSSTFDKNRTNSGKFPLRRKASKFQGYIALSTPRSPEVERDRGDHRDHAFNLNKKTISSTTEQTENIMVKAPQTTQPTVEEQETNNEPPSEWNHDDETDEGNEDGAEAKDNENDVQGSNDDNEYIFPTTSTTHEVKTQFINLEKEMPPTTEITVVASPHSAAKNKTKCKKKKHNNVTTTEELVKSSSDIATTFVPTDPSTTTASSVTPDIFEELFGGFTMDDATEKPKTESLTPTTEPKGSESEKHERYIHIDDDIENFLHSLDQKSNHYPDDDDQFEEGEDDEYDDDDDDDEDDEDSPYNNDEENSHSRNLNDQYYDKAQESQDRPLSLLEIMTME